MGPIFGKIKLDARMLMVILMGISLIISCIEVWVGWLVGWLVGNMMTLEKKTTTSLVGIVFLGRNNFSFTKAPDKNRL